MSHKLEIKNRTISLDGFLLKGVTGYEVKSSSEEDTAELTLKLIVRDSKLILDKRTNDVNSNLC